MTQALVRTARASDIPAITAIYSQSVLNGTASFELEPPDEAEMRRRFEAIAGAGYPYLVAELAGKVVGYAYANAYRTRPAYRFTVEDSIYLAPDMQGKGIGRALLDALVGACTERGYRLMLAVIGDSAQYASIRLHRSVGFTFSGTLHSVGYKFGRWLDSVIMELPLGDGDRTTPGEISSGSNRG
jgi:L-amino acid N-acyltransferase YncA